MDLAFDAGSWWAYVLVFLAAAIPVVEVLVVIPAGVIAGLAPVPVLVVAVAGNLATVALVVLAGERIGTWWRSRRGVDRRESSSHRAARARRVLQRWGVPGLGLLAPLTTGSHLAAVAALATGAGQRRVLVWMAVGLILWGVAVTVAAVVGVGWLG